MSKGSTDGLSSVIRGRHNKPHHRCEYENCRILVHGYRRFCRPHTKQRHREIALRLHAEKKLGNRKGNNGIPILYPARLQTSVSDAVEEQIIALAKSEDISIAAWLRNLIHQELNKQ